MRLITTLSLLMLSVSAWAGTFKDNFEDGNWGVWEIESSKRATVIDGVLQMENNNLYILEDWKDYRLSTDMQIVDVEPDGGG